MEKQEHTNNEIKNIYNRKCVTTIRDVALNEYKVSFMKNNRKQWWWGSDAQELN